MRRSIRISGIDCAGCAAKLESKIAKVKGIEDCSLAFMTGILYIEADERCFDRVLEDVITLIHKQGRGYEVIM